MLSWLITGLCIIVLALLVSNVAKKNNVKSPLALGITLLIFIGIVAVRHFSMQGIVVHSISGLGKWFIITALIDIAATVVLYFAARWYIVEKLAKSGSTSKK